MLPRLQPAFEHRLIMAGIFAGEGKVGPPGRLERRQRRRPPLVVGIFQKGREDVEPLPRDFGQKVVPAREVSVDGGRRHIGGLRGLGEGEPLWPLLGNQRQGRLDQRLPEVAVVIPPLHARSLGPPQILPSILPMAF